MSDVVSVIVSAPARRRFFFGILILAGYFWFCLFIFFWTPLSRVGRLAGSLVIVPAAIVDGQPIWYPRVAERAHALKATTGLKNRAAVLESLQAELHLKRAAHLAACGTADPELRIDDDADLRATLGWSKQKLERYLNAPLRAAARANVCSRVSGALDHEKSELASLRGEIKDGMPFADAAKLFSEDRSAAQGGSLGTFTKSSAPTWLAPAFSLEGDAVSDVLEAPEGLWIVRVVARGGEGEAAWVQVRGILKQAPTLEERVGSDLSTNPPWVFLW